MLLPFLHGDRPGLVEVHVGPPPHPTRATVDAFPVCSARVSSTSEGYDAMFGWVQLVRSTDGATAGRQFEPDPFVLFEDVDSPYCFFGHLPTLYDAPHRDRPAAENRWRAVSWLAATPFDDVRSVHPVCGFTWGFTVRDGVVETVPAAALRGGDWEALRPRLAELYPSWRFAAATAAADDDSPPRDLEDL